MTRFKMSQVVPLSIKQHLYGYPPQHTELLVPKTKKKHAVSHYTQFFMIYMFDYS